MNHQRTEAERDKAFADHTRTLAALAGAFKAAISKEHDMVKSHVHDTRDPKVKAMMAGAMAELETALLLIDAVERITSNPVQKGEHSVQFRIMAALHKWSGRNGEEHA
jgi:hypothetical protein